MSPDPTDPQPPSKPTVIDTRAHAAVHLSRACHAFYKLVQEAQRGRAQGSRTDCDR